MFCMKPPFLALRVFALAGICTSLVTWPVWAQTPPAPASAAPTDSGAIAQPQAATAQGDAVDAQIAAWTQTPDGAADGGANKAGIVEIQPRQIHGEAGVAIGSNGYRSGYITTDIPIGKDSDLGIAVGESQIKPKHFGKQTDKTLAISLNIGAGDLGGTVNCSSPTIAMDGRYLEPLWVSHMRGEALARDQLGCDGAQGPGPAGAQPPASPPFRSAE
jgi:hypothetical protein